VKEFIKEKRWDLVFSSFYIFVGLFKLSIGEYEKGFLWIFLGILLGMINFSLWSHGKTINLLQNYMKDVKSTTDSYDTVMESYDQMILNINPENKGMILDVQNTVKKSRLMRDEMRKEANNYGKQHTNSTAMSRG
jgi:hypothetical protein